MNLIRSLMRSATPAVRARRAVVGPRRPSWSLELEVIAEVLRRSANLSTLLPLSVQRKITDPERPVTAPMREVNMSRGQHGGVPVECFSRDDQAPEKVLLYFHGGGYSICSVNTHRDYLARLCLASGVRVIAPEYRLAPEHPFPAQLEDALAVYDAVLAKGYAPQNIVVAGESAGAGLTVSLLVSLRDAGKPQPAAATLISGWFDLNSAGASMELNSEFDFVKRRGLRVYAKRFAPASEHRNPLASPLFADLDGLPPLLVQVGAAETLLDDSLRLAERARDSGVDVDLEVWPDMIHGWHLFAPFLKEGRGAIARVGRFVAKSLASEHAVAAE